MSNLPKEVLAKAIDETAHIDDEFEVAQRLLSALGEAGYAVVPVKATDEMVNAGRASQFADGSLSLFAVWTAMLEQANV